MRGDGVKLPDRDLGYTRGIEPPFEPSYVRRKFTPNESSMRASTCRSMVLWDEGFAVQQLESMMKRLPIPDDAFTKRVRKLQKEVFEDLREAIKKFV